MAEELKAELREFIINAFMRGKGSVKDNESLFERGVMDSFGILEFVSFIEKRFKISFNPSEITLDNFNCVNKVAQLIEKKAKSRE